MKIADWFSADLILLTDHFIQQQWISSLTIIKIQKMKLRQILHI